MIDLTKIYVVRNSAKIITEIGIYSIKLSTQAHKKVTVSKCLNFRRSAVSPRRYGVCVCHLKLSSGTSSRSLEKLLCIETDL
jgi:hypothetical protein